MATEPEARSQAGTTFPSPTGARSVVVPVLGDVDAVTGPELQAHLTAIAAAEPRDVIIDLSGVRVMSAAGVGALIEVTHRLAGTGRRLRLVTGSGVVARALQTAQATDVLDAYPTLEAAEAAEAAVPTVGPAEPADPAASALEPEAAELSRLRQEVRDLRGKLESRPLIARALGILQERYRLEDPGAAFEVLRRVSTRHRVKVKTLAKALVDLPPPAADGAWPPHREPPGLGALPHGGVGRAGAVTPATVLDDVLRAAMTGTGAIAGEVRSVESDARSVVAHYGLDRYLLEFLDRIGGPGTPWAEAAAQRARVVVADVATDPGRTVATVRSVLLAAGVHAVISTPLAAPDGTCLAVVSTMHSDGLPVTAEELARLDRLADAAGGWLHWHAQEAVHDALADLADRATAAGGRHDRPATPDTPAGATAIVASSRLAVSELQLRPALARLAELVCQAVPGADAASIVLGPPADPQLLASSSTLAQTADGAQFAADRGPTFDAWSTGRPATADGGAEAFRARPGEPAVRSCLAVPLSAGSSPAPIGVLTIYAESARALEPDATLPAVAPYVARAESLVVDGTRLTNLTRTLDQMHEALSSRAVIDQAKGVLMRSRGLSAEAAFQHLRSLSNTSNRKVRDLAEEIVATAATTEA